MKISRLHKKRMIFMLFALSCMLCALALILYSLKNNINLYLTPSDFFHVKNKQQNFRLGGWVLPGSYHHSEKTLDKYFSVSDFKNTIVVHYKGLVPDLFKEGQGVIVDGSWQQDHFEASQVLAKHDEKYTPPILEKDKGMRS